jgi:hypothetical protein
MRINRRIRYAWPRHRRGMMSIEVVATIAVMVPIAAALLFLGIKMCAAVYQSIDALVSWPFL